MKQNQTPNGQERRLNKRKLCFFAEVDYAVEDNLYNHPIRDISNGGVFIETTEALNVGSDVTMLFSDFSNIGLIKVCGDIVRIMPTGVAVKFDLEKNKQKQEMLNFIDKV